MRARPTVSEAPPGTSTPLNAERARGPWPDGTLAVERLEDGRVGGADQVGGTREQLGGTGLCVPAIPAGPRATARAGVTASQRSPAATILEFFRRFNEEDVDGLLELFSEDATFSMILYERELRGKEELAEFFQMHLANWLEHREWATSVIVAGNSAASELHFEGITRGGKPVAMDNLNVWDFEGGLIRRIRVYADTAPLVEALS
jgi:ketosteroid isomerase-like protein